MLRPVAKPVIGRAHHERLPAFEPGLVQRPPHGHVAPRGRRRRRTRADRRIPPPPPRATRRAPRRPLKPPARTVGFISNDPRVGANWKKDPRDPNGPSTSGNAEQKRPVAAVQRRRERLAPNPEPLLQHVERGLVQRSLVAGAAQGVVPREEREGGGDERPVLGGTLGGSGAPPRECRQYSALSFPMCALDTDMYGFSPFTLSARRARRPPR